MKSGLEIEEELLNLCNQYVFNTGRPPEQLCMIPEKFEVLVTHLTHLTNLQKSSKEILKIGSFFYYTNTGPVKIVRTKIK